MFSFENKNLVYVGGLGGIGYETCKILMTKCLANLIVVDLVKNDEKLNNLQAISAKTKVTFHQLDTTKVDDIKRVISQIAGEIKYIDILINGAGIANDLQVDRTIDINLRGLIHTTLEALPYMNKNQNGRGGIVVNISSILGLKPCAPCLIYSATKYGVRGFTQGLADEYYFKLTGVAAMTICPGVTITPMVGEFGTKTTFEYSTALVESFLKSHPPQSAEECAINFVKSIETNQNGAIWKIEGGAMELIKP